MLWLVFPWWIVLAAEVAEHAAAEETVTLAAVGDVQLTRVVHGPEVLPEDDPFALVRDLLDADLTVGNFEGPLPAPGAEANPESPGPWLRQPITSGALLSAAGFDLVSLANNHVLDYGVDGALRTLSLLRDVGLATAGLWEDPEERFRPVVLSAKGISVGVLAYTYWLNPSGSWRRVGLGSFRVDDVAADVRALRPYVDFVVISAHWEWEDQAQAFPRFRALGRSLVDAGADLVLGHHAHVLKGCEWYRGALIAYSLGNFVFGQEEGARTEGAVLRVTLVRDARGRRLRDASFVPVRLAGPNGIPRLAEGREGRSILSRLDLYSRPLGVAVHRDGAVVPRGNADPGRLAGRLRELVAR